MPKVTAPTVEKPRFISWEFLRNRVENPYEAVIVLAREARKLNSVPYELQPDTTVKKTSQAVMHLIQDKLKFTYTEKK